MLMLKLDITKAFDTVRWEYMLELLQQLGFDQRWWDILSLIWGTTTLRIMVNGRPGRPIKHTWGLHQGDPLSPMLFILAIDPLQKILDMATTAGLLTPIGVDPIKMRTSLYAAGLLTPIGVGLIKMRTSLYADNAMLFMRPTSSDVANLRELLIHFGEAMGLHANTHKSEVFPIRCEGLDISRIVEQMQVK
jgi:hypothetical protein